MGGVECWFNKVFLGANAYVPVGTKKYDNIDLFGKAFLVSTNTPYQYNIAYTDQYDERILPGGDAELGFDITHGLTVYGGGYYFHHSGFTTVSGPKLRATYTFYRSHAHRLLGLFDRIRLEGLVTHDKPRGTNWLFGVRFTLGLAKQPNPTMGIIRHITDPIRRDLNAISGFVNTEDLLRDSNGQIVNVDLVDGINITIDEAVADTTAEIVGVIGEQTPSSTLDVGDHLLTITGGIYNFTVANHAYSLQIGNNGEITATALDPVIQMTGTNDVDIEHLTIDSDGNTAISIEDPTTTLGLLTIDGVTSNDGAFDVSLTAGGTANIAFENNTFSTTNDYTPVVSFSVEGDKIIIRKFINNKISSSGANSAGVFNKADGGDILYKGNFNFNKINISGDSTSTFTSPFNSGVSNFGLNGGLVHYFNNFNTNTITITGEGASITTQPVGIINIVSTSANIQYDGRFSGNIIKTQVANWGNGIQNETNTGNISFLGSFDNNKISTTGIVAQAVDNIIFDSEGVIFYNQVTQNSFDAFAGTEHSSYGFLFPENGTTIINDSSSEASFIAKNPGTTVSGAASNWSLYHRHE